ncbi:MAG TPA: AraC family transcriptional regulator [Verrucomicrobiae bacterium]|nr:AraC family transcriptional regulator [Verrucomicrobiae bacterium]
MPEFPVQLEIETIRLEPGHEWTSDERQWRFVHLNSGAAYWLQGSQARELTPGELLIVSPQTMGVVRASQLGEASLHCFGLRADCLLGFLSVVEREWIEHEAQRVIGPVSSLPSTHPVSKDMAFLQEAGQGESPPVRRARALLLALRALTESMPALQTESRRDGAARKRFEEMVARMPDSELIRYSSEELARLCGCTPRHFNRLFRIRFGTPKRARQTELRLLQARQLLEDSNAAIAQIAAECGYHSLSLFNSLFRRRFGMSPSEWRHRNSA